MNLELTKKTKIVLFVELAVGIAILLGSIFVLAIEGKAPTTTPAPSEHSTYISSVLHISVEYPYGWKQDGEFNGIPGIERFKGQGAEFFEVGATNSAKAPKGAIVKKYPTPIKLGETTYRYFLLKADEAHLESIADSVIFL